MSEKFRIVAPKRTYNGKKQDYHAYKDNLAEDFHNHCGYTDCADYWFGGKRTFQIDHLKPHSVYPEKKTDYANLVYCCAYVNRAKWNDDNVNYLDPCDVDYNLHFEREDDGTIVAKTEQAKYMVSHMHLNLRRYAIVWKLERLDELIEQLKKKLKLRPELKSGLYMELLELYYDYTKKLRNDL